MTWHALGVIEPFFMTPRQISQPASQLHISENGLKFIFTSEAQPNVSNFLHWPGGNSGVTLGPGYDMGGRSKEEIIADMQKIGVDKTKVVKIAEASKLTGAQAQKFVKDNASLVIIDGIQELALLKHKVPDYEKQVRAAITVDLFQYQYDALVSFAYNPGKRFSHVMGLINRGEVNAALLAIKEVNTSGGVVMKGLTDRRDREVTLYQTGDYGQLRSV